MSTQIISSAKVDSLAELRSLTTRPSKVQTTGYYTANDGGGGPDWFWFPNSVATPDNFLVVQPTSGPAGRYIRILTEGESYNPRWAGCAMDGITDDTIGLQKIASIGGSIEIDGDMLISNVTFSVDKTEIRGVKGAKIVNKAGSSSGMFKIQANYCRVENLRFEALNSPGLQQHILVTGSYYHIIGCRFVGTTSSMLTTSIIASPAYSIQVQGLTPTMIEEGHISDCRIHGGNTGFQLSGHRRFQMSDCSSTNCFRFGMVVGSGLSVQGCQITNYYALSCGSYGFTNSALSYDAGIDPVPMSGWQLTNLHSENCGWRIYFDGEGGQVGGTKYGFDLTDNGMNGLQVKASARNCAAGGLEDKGSSLSQYNTTLTTSASTASGFVLPFTSIPSTISYGLTVTGTNIPADTYVQSYTSNSVTLTRPITGTVSSGASIFFTSNIQPPGHRNTTIDFQYVSHLDSSQEGIGLFQADTTVPAGLIQNHHIRLHTVTEQAPSWRSLLPRRAFDIAAYGGLAWMCLGDLTGKAGTTGMTSPSDALGSAYVSLTTNNTTSIGSSVLNFANTTGIVDGMNVWMAGPSIPSNAYVVSHTSTTVTISSNIITLAVANGATIVFANAGHIQKITTSSTSPGNSVLNVSNTNNVQIGMNVWGLNIQDGTKVASLTSTTITLDKPVSTGSVASSATIIFASVISDGNLNWICMGADTSGASVKNKGLRTYGCKNMSIDMESIGNYIGFYLSTDGGSDFSYANLKCKARIRDQGLNMASIGIYIAGSGTISNATFIGCDVESQNCFINSMSSGGSLDASIIGGRYKSTSNGYGLQLNGGTTTMQIDGGAYFQCVGRAVSVSSGACTVRCGSVTFNGNTNGVPPVNFSGTSSGIWSWGNAVIYNNARGSAAGWQQTAGNISIRGSVLASDMTTAPTSLTKGNVGEYMILVSPTSTEYGYFCQAADFITPYFTWLKLPLAS